MAYIREVEKALNEMEWSEVVSTLEAAVMELLEETPLPPVTPPPPPAPAPSMAAQPHQHDVPRVSVPQHVYQNLHPTGFLNGEVVYGYAADPFTPPASAAPQPNTYKPNRKRNRENSENHPYIKKPLNAFMIYRKEQRANVAAEKNTCDNAVMNKILGERWNSLPKQQQAKYYEKAEKERRLHMQQHPEWSAGDNYGKYRRNNRRKTHSRAQKTRKSAVLIEALVPQTVRVESPPPQIAVTLPLSDTNNMRQFYVAPQYWQGPTVVWMSSM